MFINVSDSSYPCVLCNLNNCITCSSLTACSVCNTTNQYYLNASDNLCYYSATPLAPPAPPICGDNIKASS